MEERVEEEEEEGRRDGRTLRKLIKLKPVRRSACNQSVWGGGAAAALRCFVVLHASLL